MPSFVPSQVVDLLDRRLPDVRKQCQGDVIALAFGYQHAGVITLLVRMIDAIPEHILELRGHEALEFREAVETIRLVVNQWQTTNQQAAIRATRPGELNPVSLVRKHLVDLPDEAAGEASSAFTFVTDQALRENLATDFKAVEDAIDRRAWKSATVLGGAVIEALLLAGLLTRESDALREANRLNFRSDLARLDLCELTTIAKELQMIEGSTADECQVARGFRNLIHPGRQRRLQQPCDRGTALVTMGAVDHVIRDLRKRLQ